MNLPFSENLQVHKLSAVFASTSATYKFYWFLAIIELVEEDTIVIPKKKLFARMISNSWYTINYFHITFGKQDNFETAVKTILKEEELTIDAKKMEIDATLGMSKNPTTMKQLYHFDKNVPHWFLSPWFSRSNQKEIYQSSKKFDNDCLYALYEEEIVMNPLWIPYLKSNAKVLKDFCYWNLALFLQTRNPNVPDIPNKLIKPAKRNGLTKQTNEYWKNVFVELGSIDCIFTNTKLYFDQKNYALDHFIPHAFVSHDLIWNLIPIEKSYNGSKSDKLPWFNKHFDKFYELQRMAYEINKKHNPKSKYMDEFTTIFSDSDSFEKEKFSNTIQPLLTIASNNGFQYMNE
jgi:hypothetical protein